jgi:hypothetical protein
MCTASTMPGSATQAQMMALTARIRLTSTPVIAVVVARAEAGLLTVGHCQRQR